MRCHLIVAEKFAKICGDAFREPAGIDEDKCCSMSLDEFRETAIDFDPDFIRHDSFERRPGKFNAEIESANVTNVDNATTRFAVGGELRCSNEESCDVFDRFLGGGETDALHGSG